MATQYRLCVRTVSVVSENFELTRFADTPDGAGAVASAWLEHHSHDRDREHFGFLALDHKHRMIGAAITASGTGTSAPVDAGQFWQRVLALGAAAVVLFHTHPSGDLEPSRDDLALTKRLVDGGAILGIPVHDHLIMAPIDKSAHRWLSLRATRSGLFTSTAGGVR